MSAADKDGSIARWFAESMTVLGMELREAADKMAEAFGLFSPDTRTENQRQADLTQQLGQPTCTSSHDNPRCDTCKAVA